MKNLQLVKEQKKAQVLILAKEIQALELVEQLLADDVPAPAPAPTSEQLAKELAAKQPPERRWP